MTTLTSGGAVNLTSSTNWSPAQVPVAGDDLVIGAHTLTLDADMVLNTITLNNTSSRLAISGTSRSVEATNGFIVSNTAASIITTVLTAGMSVTLTGQWQITLGGHLNVGPFASSTGGDLTLQTVGANPALVLFDCSTRTLGGTPIVSSWTAGTLTTIGRLDFTLWTGASTLVTMTGGAWSHQSTGVNPFGSGGGRVCNLSGTATINWTGSITSYSILSGAGFFTLSSSSTSHTIGASGDTFDLKNASSTSFTLWIGQSAGTVEIFGDWYHVAGAFLTYIGPTGTLRYRSQSISIPANKCLVFLPYGGNIDLSGLVVTNSGKFAVVLYYVAATITTSSGTSVTCTSTSAFAIAIGTTAFDGKIVTLEAAPPTLPAVQDVASGEVYGYTGIELTGTGLILDPAVLAAAVNTALPTKLKTAVKTATLGTVGSGSTTTSIVTSSLSPTSIASNQFKGLIVKFTDDTTTTELRGQGCEITSSSSGGVLTVSLLTTAPVSGDTFIIQ